MKEQGHVAGRDSKETWSVEAATTPGKEGEQEEAARRYGSKRQPGNTATQTRQQGLLARRGSKEKWQGQGGRNQEKNNGAARKRGKLRRQASLARRMSEDT